MRQNGGETGPPSTKLRSRQDPVLVADLLQVQMSIWDRAKGIQCPVKGSPELHRAQRQRLGQEGPHSMSP